MSMMHSSESKRAPDDYGTHSAGVRLALRPVRAGVPSYRHLLHFAGPGGTLAVVHVVRRRPAPLRDRCGLAFSTVSLLFIFARFSFGYFIGFSLFTMVLGFIWLNTFSKFNYDHRLAGLSAAVSAVLFLLARPAHQHARQTAIRAVASRARTPSEIHSGAGAGNDRRGLILQFQTGVDQADLRFSQRSLLSGADTLPDRNCVHRAAAVRLRLLSGAQSPLVGCRAPHSDAAVLSDHAQQICAFFDGVGRCPADAFEDFRGQGCDHPVDPSADAARRDPDGSVP